MPKIKFGLAFLCTLCWSICARSQVTESGTPTKNWKKPLNGVYVKEISKEKRTLAYSHIREADVFWEKRVEQIIDVNEKMNKTFVYKKLPFLEILKRGVIEGKVTMYDPQGSGFSLPFSREEAMNVWYSRDTVEIIDVNTSLSTMVPVENEVNFMDFKRFRIEEVWFFDEETSTMQVRILGIAGLKEKFDDNGNFMFEYPEFVMYYPELREYLTNFEAFNPISDASRMSWEDLFEMRLFSSYIAKASNVEDQRIKDYKAGLNILLEAEAIKSEIFNFQHDLWSY